MPRMPLRHQGDSEAPNNSSSVSFITHKKGSMPRDAPVSDSPPQHGLGQAPKQRCPCLGYPASGRAPLQGLARLLRDWPRRLAKETGQGDWPRRLAKETGEACSQAPWPGSSGRCAGLYKSLCTGAPSRKESGSCHARRRVRKLSCEAKSPEAVIRGEESGSCY